MRLPIMPTRSGHELAPDKSAVRLYPEPRNTAPDRRSRGESGAPTASADVDHVDLSAGPHHKAPGEPVSRQFAPKRVPEPRTRQDRKQSTVWERPGQAEHDKGTGQGEYKARSKRDRSQCRVS